MPYHSDPHDSSTLNTDSSTARTPLADLRTKSLSRWKDQLKSPIHLSFLPHPLHPISIRSKPHQLVRQPHPPGRDTFHLQIHISLNSFYLFPHLNPISNGQQTLQPPTLHLNLLLSYYIPVNLYLIYRD
jgi:hypothetical protein